MIRKDAQVNIRVTKKLKQKMERQSKRENRYVTEITTWLWERYLEGLSTPSDK